METINAYIEGFSQAVSLLILNTVFYSCLGGVAGLIFGVLIIRWARKKRIFIRNNSIWTFLAKSNYILLPLSLSLLGITQGGIYGVHTTANGWIDQTSRPIIDYAEQYIPSMQQFCNAYILDNPGGTIKEAVRAHNPKASSGMTGKAAITFNTMMLGAFLDITTPVGAEAIEPVALISQIDIHKLDRKIFEVIPASMKVYSGYHFGLFYVTFFIPFGYYFLFLISEFILYKVFGKKVDSVQTKPIVESIFDSDDWEYV